MLVSKPPWCTSAVVCRALDEPVPDGRRCGEAAQLATSKVQIPDFDVVTRRRQLQAAAACFTYDKEVETSVEVLIGPVDEIREAETVRSLSTCSA